MKWKIIAKYIFGEATQEEIRKVERWKNKTTENKKTIEKLHSYLTKEMEPYTQKNINVDKAWENLKARINDYEVKSDAQEISHDNLFSRPILKYAAILLVFIGLSALVYFSYQSYWQNNYMTIETSMSEKKEDLYLPDGTIAFLNGNSKINYPKTYGDEERYVNIEGEAYFDVKRDITKPFIVKAKKAEVKVLGTAFNVRTDLPDNAVEVIVESGKVKFYKSGSEAEAITLEPGFIGLLRDNQLHKKRNDDINYLAWKNGKLLFKETNLDTVVNKLNHAYNVTIKIDESKINNYELSATFENEPVEEILRVITRTFNLELVEKDNKEYILTSKN